MPLNIRDVKIKYAELNKQCSATTIQHKTTNQLRRTSFKGEISGSSTKNEDAHCGVKARGKINFEVTGRRSRRINIELKLSGVLDLHGDDIGPSFVSASLMGVLKDRKGKTVQGGAGKCYRRLQNKNAVHWVIKSIRINVCLLPGEYYLELEFRLNGRAKKESHNYINAKFTKDPLTYVYFTDQGNCG